MVTLSSKASSNLLITILSNSVMQVVGRAKRVPHWGVQSIFRVIYNMYLFYTSYSYNNISQYAYCGISAHIPRRDLVIFSSWHARCIVINYH